MKERSEVHILYLCDTVQYTSTKGDFAEVLNKQGKSKRCMITHLKV